MHRLSLLFNLTIILLLFFCQNVHAEVCPISNMDKMGIGFVEYATSCEGLRQLDVGFSELIGHAIGVRVAGTDDREKKYTVGGIDLRLGCLVFGYSVYYDFKAEHDTKTEKGLYCILNDSQNRMSVFGGGFSVDRDGKREKFISYEGRLKDLERFPFYIRGTVLFRPDDEVVPQISLGIWFPSSYLNDDK